MSQLLPGMYEYDRAESDARFKDTVWPQILKWDWFLGGNLRPSNENLDWMSDGDFLIKTPNGLIVIGTRVQRTDDHETMTIRSQRQSGARTELAKMLWALTNGGLFAGYRIHAYVCPQDRELLAVYGVKTRELHNFMTDYPQLVRENTAKSDGNKFKVIHISDLKLKGVDVREYQFSAADFLLRCHMKHRDKHSTRTPTSH